MGRKQPNIVMILTDDQGIWSLGCYGNQEIHTPNLDKLAKDGMLFENFFCTSPVCSPARASLLTGKIPSQHGIHDYLSGGNGGCGQESIAYLERHLGYTDILAEHGYTCGLSGKWHLGDGLNPQKGFTFWYAHQKGGGPYYQAPMIRDGELVNEPGYITDVITQEALNFIDREKGKETPFYLSVHYTAPHSPWIEAHPKAYTDLYQDCKFESCPQTDTPHPWARLDTMEGYQKPRECLIGYFAAVTAMDASVGCIMEKLEAEHLKEDTLIIFTSDNGFNCGHHGVWGKGNGTFPVNMYDSSVKVPFVMCHPGRIPAGSIAKRMCSGYDFMPTLLDYVGLCEDQPEELPGRSFCDTLTGGDGDDAKGTVVIFDEYGPVRMIRSDQYKLIYRYVFGPNEFYDLQADPDEAHNLYGEPAYQDIIGSMKHQLDVWFVTYADPKLDGSREPVTGDGQRFMAGTRGPGIFVYGSKEK